MPTLPIIEEEPNVSQPDKVVSIYACALRLARLAADGSTPAGATNGYITNNLITLSLTPDVDEGTDFSSKNACGDDAFPVRDRPTIKRINLSMTLELADPELAELLTASPLILNTPASSRTTAANGTTTTGSPVISSATAAFSNLDLGAAVTGTGVGASATIISVQSATQATLNVNSTATSSAVAFTIIPIALAIGSTFPALGIQAADNGVSLEVWTKVFDGAGPAAVLPYIKHALTRTYWRHDTREFTNAKQGQAFTGYAIENPGWGNGPFNDWVDNAPSSRTLTRAYGWHRDDVLPTPANGYSVVPSQI